MCVWDKTIGRGGGRVTGGVGVRYFVWNMGVRILYQSSCKKPWRRGGCGRGGEGVRLKPRPRPSFSNFLSNLNLLTAWSLSRVCVSVCVGASQKKSCESVGGGS